MPFVETGDEHSHQERNRSPSHAPCDGRCYGKRCPPCPKQQEAQREVSDKMACLPNVEMPNSKAAWIQSEKKMQNGIQKFAGIIRGKITGRFDPDNAQPNNGGDPRFPELSGRFLQWAVLFHGVVRGLAGDHDVVYMAFAQSCHTDANEACFLEQLRNRGTPAVSHTGLQAAYHLMNDHRN